MGTPSSRATGAGTASRGASVVDAVLGATLSAVARVGYAGLSVEEVAKAAGVNRTTVYRRWPTKLDLLSAALVYGIPTDVLELPDTGSIQGDLVAIGCGMYRFAQTEAGRAAMRVFFFESQQPELAELALMMEKRTSAAGIPGLIHRAVARGELPVGFDIKLLDDTLAFSLLCAGLVHDGPPDESRIAKLVGVLLRGLRAPA